MGHCFWSSDFFFRCNYVIFVSVTSKIPYTWFGGRNLTHQTKTACQDTTKTNFCNLGELCCIKPYTGILNTEEMHFSKWAAVFFKLQPHSASYPEAVWSHSAFFWCALPPQWPWRMLSSVSKAEAGHLTAHLCHTLYCATISPLPTVSHHCNVFPQEVFCFVALLLWPDVWSAIAQYILLSLSTVSTADSLSPLQLLLTISVRSDFTAS